MGKVTWEDVAKHKTEEDGVWLAISGKAYDVTKFLCEHPGGEEVMMEVTGMDATADFEDVGHSDEARKMMEDTKSGIVVKGDIDGEIPEEMKAAKQEDGGIMAMLVPIVLVVIAGVVYTQF